MLTPPLPLFSSSFTAYFLLWASRGVSCPLPLNILFSLSGVFFPLLGRANSYSSFKTLFSLHSFSLSQPASFQSNLSSGVSFPPLCLVEALSLNPPLASVDFRVSVSLRDRETDWELSVASFSFLIFTYLSAPGLSYIVRDLQSWQANSISRSVWDLVPWPGIEPGAPCTGSMES